MYNIGLYPPVWGGSMIDGRYCGSLVIVLPFNLCLIPILHVCSLLQQGLRISWQRFTWYKPLTSLTYCKAFSCWNLWRFPTMENAKQLSQLSYQLPILLPSPLAPLPTLPLRSQGPWQTFHSARAWWDTPMTVEGRYLSTWAGSQTSVLVPGVPKSSHLNGVIKYQLCQNSCNYIVFWLRSLLLTFVVLLVS